MRVAWCARVLLIGATVSMVSGHSATAQQGGGPPPKGDRPRPPLERALDANGDGTIGADEIAAAASALKKLDKNADGKLTPDEYRPPRPPHPEGQGPGPGGRGSEPIH